MAADPRDQLRADRARRAAEEAADADQRDWRHDTLDLDPVVVDGSVVRARTHGAAGHAVRRAWRTAPRRLPAGLVVGAVLLLGAGAVSAVAGAGLPTGPTAVEPSATTAPSAVVVDPEVDGDAAAAAPAPAAAPDRVTGPPAPGTGPGPAAGPAGEAAPAGPGRP